MCTNFNHTWPTDLDLKEKYTSTETAILKVKSGKVFVCCRQARRTFSCASGPVCSNQHMIKLFFCGGCITELVYILLALFWNGWKVTLKSKRSCVSMMVNILLQPRKLQRWIRCQSIHTTHKVCNAQSRRKLPGTLSNLSCAKLNQSSQINA